MAKTYTLYIDAYSPETIPMARLAQYMQGFAALLAQEGGVHFQELKPGSTRLVSRVDREHVPKVDTNLRALMIGDPDPDGMKARETIDQLLAEDNATGFIYEDDDCGNEIVAFAGATKPRVFQYGPIKQEGTLDGVLVGIGGTDKTVHLRLQNGDIKYSNIDTDRDTARRLGQHLFEPIRIFGVGTWSREQNASWALKRFRINSFEVLRSDDLIEILNELRAVEGSEWASAEDPLTVLRNLRDDNAGLH